MKSQMLNGRLAGEQTGPARSAGTNLEVSLVEAKPDEEEETLVSDRRGNLTPSQIVEQRLAALLATGRPRPVIDSAGRLLDVSSARRRPDELGKEGEQMNSPQPKVEKTGDVTIITFTGDVTRGLENRLAAELEGRTGGAGEVHVLLDFTNVDRINSEEMGTLIDLHKKVRTAGGRLTLFNLDPNIYEAFTVTHLQTLLKICREADPAPSPQEA